MGLKWNHSPLAISLVAFTAVAGQSQAAESDSSGEDAVIQLAAAQNMQSSGSVAGSGTVIEQIVVTSSRLREESVQNVPLAVSVLTGDFVEDLNTADIRGLSAIVPNLNITPQGATPNAPVINLRGFGVVSTDISVEPGVSVYVDGVYQTTITGTMTNLFDVESVEVLRGPQGTLLGKNASAGAILIKRSRPTHEFSGRAEIEYGTFDNIQAQGLVNFPIVKDVLAGKAYIHYRNHDDYVKSQVVPDGDMGGVDRGTARLAFLFTPTENFELYLTGDYNWDRSSQAGLRGVSTPDDLVCVLGGVCDGPDTGGYQVHSNGFIDKPSMDEYNLTAQADWQMGGVTLTSILGYRRYDQTTNVDLDGTTLPILEVFDNRTLVDQYSAEVRLKSTPGGGLDLDGRLTWLLAAYYGKFDAYQEQGTRAFGNNRTQAQATVKDTYAIFGQADFEVVDSLFLTFGARQSWDDVKHDFNLSTPGTEFLPLEFTQSTDFKNTSLEGGARYQIDDTKMVYFRYAEGYRGGGYIGLPGSLAASEPPYGPETSKSYEIGGRTEFFDRRLLLNLTLFNVKFSDLQRTTALPGPNNTFVQTTSNVAEARTRGVELEAVIRPTDSFTIRATGGYLDAEYTDYTVQNPDGSTTDLSALPFNFTAKWTASAYANYDVALPQSVIGFETLGFHGGVNWRSSMIVSNTVPNPVNGEQNAYALVDLGLNLESGGETRYRVGFYVNNLFDKKYKTYTNALAGLVHYTYDNIGRTWGVTAGLNF